MASLSVSWWTLTLSPAPGGLGAFLKNSPSNFRPASSSKFKFSPNTSVIAFFDKSSSVSSSGSGPAGAGAGFSGFGFGGSLTRPSLPTGLISGASSNMTTARRFCVGLKRGLSPERPRPRPRRPWTPPRPRACCGALRGACRGADRCAINSLTSSSVRKLQCFSNSGRGGKTNSDFHLSSNNPTGSHRRGPARSSSDNKCPNFRRSSSSKSSATSLMPKALAALPAVARTHASGSTRACSILRLMMCGCGNSSSGNLHKSSNSLHVSCECWDRTMGTGCFW
mmetsp:Transcript_19327/g.55101  ORF Transcript_19327/g.55101 Transcript_19327/m.55101 type:complete len:281 (+) Transcript_19327:116-958(+)